MLYTVLNVYLLFTTGLLVTTTIRPTFAATIHSQLPYRPIDLDPYQPMLVDLSNRNTIAATIVDIVNDSYITLKRKRVFNIYAHVELRPTQRKIGFFGEVVDETLRRLMQQIVNSSNTIAVRVGMAKALPTDNERHYCVLLVDSCAALKLLYQRLRAERVNISGFFLIFLHTFTPYYYNELDDILGYNWKLGIINANVLVYVPSQQLLLFAGEPYNMFHCGGYAPTIQNRYIYNQWRRNVSFFPNRLDRLYGCPLVCATWSNMPYLGIPNASSGNKNIGIEGKILDYLASKMNFTLKFYWLNKKEIENDLNAQGDVYFDNLFMLGIDFVVGALRYKPISSEDSYTPTTPYYLSSYHFISNSHFEPYSPFMKLLLPFVYDTWGFIVLCYFSGSLLCILTRCTLAPSKRNFIIGAGNQTPIYNMFIVSLGGTVTTPPNRNFARYLLLLWLITTLVLRSAYQAFMYHFIRSDLNRLPPSSIDELLMQNYTLIMSHVNYNAVLELPFIRSLAHITNFSNFEAFDWLRSTPSKNIAILSSYEAFGYYKRKHIQAAADFYVMPEKMFTQQLSFYLRKNSMLLKRFNRYLGEYVNSGLMSKWENVFIDTSGARHAYRRRGTEMVPPQEMKLLQLSGAFRLLAIGNAIALLFFIGEVMLYNISMCIKQFKHRISQDICNKQTQQFNV